MVPQKLGVILQQGAQNAKRLGPHAVRNIELGQPQTGRITPYATGLHDKLNKLMFNFLIIGYRAKTPRCQIEK